MKAIEFAENKWKLEEQAKRQAEEEEKARLEAENPPVED